MSREEQTIQAAKDFLPHITNAQLTLFAAGAMWADEHPKEGLWERDKVIKWIKDHLRFEDDGWHTDIENYKNTIDIVIEDLIKSINE